MTARSKSNGGPTGRIVGYARVSTDGQSLDGQLATLKQHGASVTFREKISGARSDRPQLRKALNALGKGDTLVVSRLDRLARSMRDLLNVLHEIGERGAFFKGCTTRGPIARRHTAASCSPSSAVSLTSSGR